MDNLGTLTVDKYVAIVAKQKEEAIKGKLIREIRGFEKLSKLIGGFNDQRLGMLLGGTGFGKTNFAITITLAAAKTMRVGYVNMEMSHEDMAKRFAITASRISYEDYNTGRFELDLVGRDLKESGNRIHVTNGKATGIVGITKWLSAINVEHANDKVKLLIVDYDQRIDLGDQGRMEEFKALQVAMMKLEDIAKEHSLYVLVLGQVNREGTISGSHRATFVAHTVMKFHEHETLGPIIEPLKNRHGKHGYCVTLSTVEGKNFIGECSECSIPKPVVGEKFMAKAKKTGGTFGF